MAFHFNPVARRKMNRTLHTLKSNKPVLLGGTVALLFLIYLLYARRNEGAFEENTISVKNAVEKPRGCVVVNDMEFMVRGKQLQILSGAIHYFRIVPHYWEDRLRKLKAMGLNTVETYVPWNLHEPLPGQYDFGGMLDIREFILIAQKLGLNVIVRPGPYICAEWENGGLPAWLLHDPKMRVRTNYEPYMAAVKRYFNALFSILSPLQCTNGGPIIAFQVENEYTQYGPANSTGKDHMFFLTQLMYKMGMVELLVTSDGPSNLDQSLYLAPEHAVLTLNFQSHTTENIERFFSSLPNRPLMVMEYWSGWFDHWGHGHLERDVSVQEITQNIGKILAVGGSFNLYMFHGGTSFGFMNGANINNGEYLPQVTSYDYGAPLSEAGDITAKYLALRDLLKDVATESIPNPLPDIPPDSSKMPYGSVHMSLYIKLLDTLDYIPAPIHSPDPLPMECLSVNDGTGQAYGYVMYRTTIPSSSKKITITKLRDYGLALRDGIPVAKLGSFSSQSFLLDKSKEVKNANMLDLFVENSGRVNFGKGMADRKGISGKVIVDDFKPHEWEIYSFEFKTTFIEQIQSGGLWSRTPSPNNIGPALYKGDFTISDPPKDTFLNMQGWTKGVVFLNGINLGRYWKVGPQKTLYVPAPLLRRGINKLLIFEMHRPKDTYSVEFLDSPILDSND